MIKTIEKLNKGFCLAEKYAMVAIFVAVCAVMTIQIILRYIFNNPLVWSEEFSRFGYVWITWIGCAFCTGIDNHVRIPIVYDRFPKKLQKVCYYITSIFILFVIIYLIPVSFEFAMREHRFKSGTMGVPMSVLFISLTVGLVLTAIQIVFEMILHYRNKEAA